ncbi:unnamed protein product [Diabrotica balteata]|uniref:Large ribosomal subunit protein mL40 n=1 Tax=Diabrotica balteata TaxID=107213 RepID=A0A9P0E1D1_DIABA|nr:unnamed protein product [Diabrotica balteata]
MTMNAILSNFSRLSLKAPTLARTIYTNKPLAFKFTPVLLAEPLKKKKRLDPAVVKAREERKKRKLEKQIRRLEKNARKLKPIEECEPPFEVLDTIQSRKRNLAALSTEILERRALLQKKWCHHKREEHLRDMQMLDRMSYSQQRALDELRKESEELYQEAIQFDFHLMPFTSQGPVETPPIENYNSPDGDYQDVSKKW